MLPIPQMLSTSRDPSSTFSNKQDLRPIDLSLGLVTNRASASHEAEFLYKSIQAIKGGTTYLQLRDRNKDVQASIQTAYRLKQLIAEYGIPLLINNRVDVALAVGADGVHLGQKDFPVNEARKLLGKKAIIGLTVETLDDVYEAEKLDVDYLGVQLFPSKVTKPESSVAWGLDGLRKIKAISRHRLVLIGGIGVDNLEQICSFANLSKTQDGIAMTGELWRADDPYVVAQKICTILNAKHAIRSKM